MGTICLTFDNMGSALQVGNRTLARPGPDDIGPLGYPEALTILERTGLQATFFVEGWNALHNPVAIRSLIDRGHEVAPHGWVHEKLGSMEEIDLIRIASDATAAFRSLGIEPNGFRSPGGRAGPYLRDELRSLGYRYDSSVDHEAGEEPDLGPSDEPYRSNGLTVIPWRWLNIDYYHYAMHPDVPRSPRQVRDHFIDQVDLAASRGGTATFIFHAFVSCIDTARRSALIDILHHAARTPGIEIITSSKLADAYERKHARKP